MDNLGSILKKLRDKNGYTGKDVSSALLKNGYEISDKTLYNYEKGLRMPNADVFMELCQIYNCRNILETFCSVEVDRTIPDDKEWNLIKKYRDLDSHGKEVVDFVLNKEYDRFQNSEYIEVAARGGKYKVKREDILDLAERMNSEPYEKDDDLC